MQNQKKIEQKWNQFQKENPEYVKAFSTEWVRLKEQAGENEPTVYLTKEEKQEKISKLYSDIHKSFDELFN